MEKQYIIEILTFIREEKNDDILKDKILNYHENDIAKVFPLMTKEERFRMYKIIDQDILSDIFSYLEDPIEYLDELSSEKAADIIESMDTDDAIDILEEYEEEERQEIIELMDKEAVEDIKLIISYDEDMIGSKMTTNFISINKNSTIKKAMKRMVDEAAENDNLSVLYFVDDSERYFGAMNLRDLIIARENEKLEDLIMTSYPCFFGSELVSDCIGKIKEYALDSIPIVDENKKLIGVITSDDVVEVVQDEMGEDYAKLAGLSSEEELDESLLRSVKKRIPWLVILLFLGLITSLLISNFESVVVALPIIVFFQSLILDMAGNSGTQSLGVTIRALTDDNMTKKDVRRLIFKEFRIGFLNGLIISLISVVIVLVFLLVFENFDFEKEIKTAFVVGASMLCSMTVASSAGSFIPVIFKKCKIDPAVASGPFITTLNDVIAMLIYYGLAWLLFLNI